MTKSGAPWLVWTPRIAGAVMSAFLALFALDAFEGKAFLEGLPAFAIHLAPSAVVLAAVAIAWRFPLAGAGAFALFAVGYGVMVRWRLDWVAVIAGPLAVVAALYFLSWRYGSSDTLPA